MRELENKLQKLLYDVHKAIVFDQPELTASVYGCLVIIKGFFNVLPRAEEIRSGGRLDRFEIRLELSSKFPYDEPRLLETGKRIPKTDTRHINSDKSCCYVIWEEWLINPKSTSIKALLDGPIYDYFFSQYYFENFKKWPFDDYDHGKIGMLQSFSNTLTCRNDENEVMRWLIMLSKPKIKGHWPCPCNSNKIIRCCCTKNYNHPPVPQWLAKRMYKRLKTNT